MIKNKKGISVISVIITIIILIMIASITTFTGTSMLNNTRRKAAEDRLKIIYNAIIAHEEELGYANWFEPLTITDRQYDIMGLSDYADEDNFTPVSVSKSIDPSDNTKRIYKLETLIKKNSKEPPVILEQSYNAGISTSNTKIEFDVKKGVNRPQIVGNMIPLSTYLDEDGDIRTVKVQNVYAENWYDYSFTTPRWANMELDNVAYVWIPRFAYKIQDFYLEKDYENIPNTAISIVYLKEDTDYMSNGEILPDGYQVHPAFSNENEELAGIWISKRVIGDTDNIEYALESSANMHSSSSTLIESHLMKNTEWAAMAYLSFACGGTSKNGNTLNNSFGIENCDDPLFVAASLNSADKFGYADAFDVYEYKDSSLTYDSNEIKKNGDALIATSSGTSENSAWFKTKSELPTDEKPYIIRRGDLSFFAYEASGEERQNTSYRNVLKIKGTFVANNKAYDLASIKVGDYVKYTPDTAVGSNVYWRVWKTNGNEVVIMPTTPVGSLRLGDSGDINKCLNDYYTAEEKVLELCRDYKSSSLGITETDVASLTIEDLEDSNVSTLATQKISVSNYNVTKKFTSGNYHAANYNPSTGKNEKSPSFIKATSSVPVTVNKTYYSISTPGWKNLPGSETETYGTLLGTTSGWLASTCINWNTLALYEVWLAKSNEVIGKYLFYSSGGKQSFTYGVRPLITLKGSQLSINSTNPGDGSSSAPWNIVKK